MKRKKMKPKRVWMLVGVSDGYCYFGTGKPTRQMCLEQLDGRKTVQECRVAHVEIREVPKRRKAVRK